jgi:hypothetical protein
MAGLGPATHVLDGPGLGKSRVAGHEAAHNTGGYELLLSLNLFGGGYYF